MWYKGISRDGKEIEIGMKGENEVIKRENIKIRKYMTKVMEG